MCSADLVCEMKGLFQTHRPRCRSLVNRPGSSNRETALKWAGKVLPDECNLKDIVMCMTLYDIVRMMAEGSQHSDSPATVGSARGLLKTDAGAAWSCGAVVVSAVTTTAVARKDTAGLACDAAMRERIALDMISLRVCVGRLETCGYSSAGAYGM